MKNVLIIALALLVVVLAIVSASRSNPAAMPSIATSQPGDESKQLWTCGMHPQVVQDHPGDCPICHMRLTPMRNRATTKGSASAVMIDPAIVQNMGVRTTDVVRGDLIKTVRTTGVIEAPEPGVREINLKANGWIKKLYANQEGQHVHQGDPLFDLYSPDLVVGEEELASAIKSRNALPQNADSSLRKSADDLIESAKRKLTLLDVPQTEIDRVTKQLTSSPIIKFTSPISGAIEEKMVVEGSAITSGMKIMRIEDHSALWLDLQVYEEQFALVNVGANVEASVAAYPGWTFKGTITFIRPHLDHMSRTATARATIENAEGKLRPGMYASAVVFTMPMKDSLLVPRDAVIDTGTRQLVFIAKESGHFEPRNVRMGAMGDDGRVQILSGLSAGETVVTSGQFLMDVESRVTEAIEKLRSGGGGDASTATTMPAMEKLSVAYCSMNNAWWLQQGSKIANPYLGQVMSDCGEVRQTVMMPHDSSPLKPVVDAYLKVQSALVVDKVDPITTATLASAAHALAGPEFAAIKNAADAVAAGKDLTDVRGAMKHLSDALIAATTTNGGQP